MKNYCDRLGFLSALTVMLMAAPSIAAERNITEVELKENNNRLELKLSTSKSNKANSKASFYTLQKGNTIEANLLYLELKR